MKSPYNFHTLLEECTSFWKPLLYQYLIPLPSEISDLLL